MLRRARRNKKRKTNEHGLRLGSADSAVSQLTTVAGKSPDSNSHISHQREHSAAGGDEDAIEDMYADQNNMASISSITVGGPLQQGEQDLAAGDAKGSDHSEDEDM